MKDLDKNIGQADNFIKYKPFYNKCKQQKPKHKEQHYETYRAEITLFEAAQKYLADVLNGRITISTKAWKAEREKLTADKNRLSWEYYSLKNDTAAVEKIRSNAYDIISEESRGLQHTRAQDLEL